MIFLARERRSDSQPSAGAKGSVPPALKLRSTDSSTEALKNSTCTDTVSVARPSISLPWSECFQLKLMFISREMEMMPRTDTSPPMSMNPWIFPAASVKKPATSSELLIAAATVPPIVLLAFGSSMFAEYVLVLMS